MTKSLNDKNSGWQQIRMIKSPDDMMMDRAGGRGPGATCSLGIRGSHQGSARSQAAEEGRGGADHFFRPLDTFTHFSLCSPLHLISSSQVSAMAKQLSKAEQEIASMKKKKK